MSVAEHHNNNNSTVVKSRPPQLIVCSGTCERYSLQTEKPVPASLSICLTLLFRLNVVTVVVEFSMRFGTFHVCLTEYASRKHQGNNIYIVCTRDEFPFQDTV